jgi:coenzyme F420-reducing hydrogenase beta subunit
MQKDDEGFVYPNIVEDECINCGVCKKVCPFSDLEKSGTGKLKAYAAYSMNENDVLTSSSGGIFSVLCRSIIAEDGIVYGVAMSGDCKSASHIRVVNEEDMELLKGSKYLQSETEHLYIDIKADLEEGKKILFSGTPCQINGLHEYLGKAYGNLLCVDVVCHGVPSQKLWEKYVNYLEKKYKRKMLRVNFKSKDKSWNDYGIEKEFEKNLSNISIDLMTHIWKCFCVVCVYDLRAITVRQSLSDLRT